MSECEMDLRIDRDKAIKLGTKATNQFWPFTREEFFYLHDICHWAQFERHEKNRVRDFKQLKKREKF